MLCTSSCLGDAVPSDSVGHISYPSISRLLTSPPARPYSVGSQSDKCIRSMLTRPLDANRGLWMKDVPRMPPVGIDAGYNFEHCLHSKEPSSWEEDDVIIYRETSTYCTVHRPLYNHHFPLSPGWPLWRDSTLLHLHSLPSHKEYLVPLSG